MHGIGTVKRMVDFFSPAPKKNPIEAFRRELPRDMLQSVTGLISTATLQYFLIFFASASEPTMSPQWMGTATTGFIRLTASAASVAVIV